MKEHFTGDSHVFVIDDDASVRLALRSLFESVGLHVQLFSSTNEFLESQVPDVASCLVLDVRLPGKSGLAFQQDLAEANFHVPIIFITGHGDIRMSVRAMKAGAVEFLIKPLSDQDLLDAVYTALERDQARREHERTISIFRELFDTLSAREREVVQGVVAGRLNKQIAAELDISEFTVKVHRGNAMRKIQARSLAELVRMADRLEDAL